MKYLRFKTKEEFIEEFGENWMGNVASYWNSGGDMDYLHGTSHPEDTTKLDCWDISSEMLTRKYAKETYIRVNKRTIGIDPNVYVINNTEMRCEHLRLTIGDCGWAIEEPTLSESDIEWFEDNPEETTSTVATTTAMDFDGTDDHVVIQGIGFDGKMVGESVLSCNLSDWVDTNGNGITGEPTLVYLEDDLPIPTFKKRNKINTTVKTNKQKFNLKFK